MKASPTFRVLAAGAAVPPDALRQPDWSVTAHPLTASDPDGLAAFHLVVLDGGAGAEAALTLGRRWRPLLTDPFVPMLYLAPDASDAATLAGFAAGADACLPRSAIPPVVAAQARALLRWQQSHAHLAGRAAEAQQINHRLQQVYHQIDADLEMARRIHRGLLPRDLPTVGRARFAVCHRPRSRVGGDLFDVFRLDEDHVAFYVADALGRGASSSSLMTIFLKETVGPKQILGRSYRLVPPDEVLQALNRELATLGLAEPPCATMLYGLLNCRDGQFGFARASHPPPVHVPAEGPPEVWDAPGSLLGLFDAEFPAQSRQLRPGDKVIFHTDGLAPAGTPGAADIRELLLDSASRHRGLPVQAFVDYLVRDLFGQSRQPDDFTLLCLELSAL